MTVEPPTALTTDEYTADADRFKPYKLRGEVVDRLVLASRRYSRHHLNRAYDREHPLGQHFVVFFYREPEGTTDPLDLLKVASRIDQAGDDVADLYRVVTQLHFLATQYAARGRFDPRHYLANRIEDMTSAAQYVGVGVGTLVPPDVAADDSSSLGPLPGDALPFRGIAALHDGTRLVVRWKGGISVPQAQTNRTLNYGQWQTRMWGWLGDEWGDVDAEVSHIGPAVAALNQFILQHHVGARHSRRATPHTVTAVQPVDDLLGQRR